MDLEKIMQILDNSIAEEYKKNITIAFKQNKDESISCIVTYFNSLYTEKEIKALFFKLDGGNIVFRSIFEYVLKSAKIPYMKNKSEQLIVSSNDIEEYAPLIFENILKKCFQLNSFGCCHNYLKCSDLKKCIHDDLIYSTACMYRKNLESGKIFYGKNRNI